MKNLLALLVFGLIIGSVLVAGTLLVTTGLSYLSAADAWGCPYPETLSTIAGEIGGSSTNEWHKSGAKSYTYDGTSTLTYRIPEGCVLAVGGSYYRAGQTVQISAGDSLSW